MDNIPSTSAAIDFPLAPPPVDGGVWYPAGGGVAEGASPDFSRGAPQFVQNPAPIEFCVPQFLQMIIFFS
jgi:hypothetical protein